MSDKITPSAADYIQPLNMNGLRGRMLRMPPPAGKKREILFVYGHHSSLERWWGAMQEFNRYGGVTMPDLPGFGGMDSFYKIGRAPTVDALADYLAAFIKLRYKRRRLTIIGLSFGFVVTTRMLQRYPDLAKRVNLLVSVVGFSHYRDFTFSWLRRNSYRLATKAFSYRLPAIFFKGLVLNPALIRYGYAHTHNARQKFAKQDAARRREYLDFEVHLWHSNDVRTYMYTSNEFLAIDNCAQRVDLPLHHVSVKADQYFDASLVEQHLRTIYRSLRVFRARTDNHAPTVMASRKEAAAIVPAGLRRILKQD